MARKSHAVRGESECATFSIELLRTVIVTFTQEPENERTNQQKHKSEPYGIRCVKQVKHAYRIYHQWVSLFLLQ